MKTLNYSKYIAFFAFLFWTATSSAQSTYNNNYQDLNFGGTGSTISYFPAGSAGTEEGEVTLYEGVTVLNGDTLDCYVVVEYVNGNISAIDKSATTGSAGAIIEPDFFAPQFSFGGSSGGFGGEAVLSFNFIEHGSFSFDTTDQTYTATPVVLQNVQVNSYDLDGLGSQNSEQANSFTDFLVSQLDNNTNILTSYDASSDSYLFKAGTYKNIADATLDENRVRILYQSVSTIQIKFLGSNSYYAFLDFGGGLPYTNQPSDFYNVIGMVFDDADGASDGVVDGSGIGAADGVQLYVNLADSNGSIVDVYEVGSDGTFVFPAMPVANYSVTVTDTSYGIGLSAPSSRLPSLWAPVGEMLGSILDANANGVLEFNSSSLNLGGVSLGIDKRPESDSIDVVIKNPTLTEYMTLGANPTEILSGTDLEEGVLGHGTEIWITELPKYDQLFYNNSLIVYGQDGINPPSISNPFVISAYDTARLKVKFMNMTTNYLSFRYSLVDAAGLVDSSPAVYTITWPTILPVDFLDVSAELINNNDVEVEWVTASEHNNDYFVIERRMANEDEFIAVGEIKGAGNSNQILNYSFVDRTVNWSSDAALYRIKQVDFDGRFSYSQAVLVENQGRVDVQIYPNPVVDVLHIELEDHAASLVRVVDIEGRIVLQQEAEGALLIPTAEWAGGTYFVQVIVRGHMNCSRVQVVRERI